MAAFSAIMLFSCSEEPEAELIDFRITPTQVINNLEMVQTENGAAVMRMDAPKMEHFEFQDDSIMVVYDYYPDGFHVRLFTADGILETEITSKEAKHETTIGREQWSAFGEVVMHNYPRMQKMETDTIYWDQINHKIYNDCYVKMTSAQGVMQGYGMETDEKVRDAIIHRPFNSFSVFGEENSKQQVDTVNFIGPPVQRFGEK